MARARTRRRARCDLAHVRLREPRLSGARARAAQGRSLRDEEAAARLVDVTMTVGVNRLDPGGIEPPNLRFVGAVSRPSDEPFFYLVVERFGERAEVWC